PPARVASFRGMSATGVPVAIAMAGSALVYILLTGDTPPFVVVHRMISGIDSFPLLAVPFFILAGNLMNNAGITNRIYDFALALVGWLKGGLGHVTIIGSVVFAGMSGTAIADAASLGTIEIKAMRDKGYDIGFSVGVTAASATLGPIIPPSLPFVIYGMMANVSVGQLFLAGIIPGAVMALLMMLTVGYYAHKYSWGGDVKFDWPRLAKALSELPILIGCEMLVKVAMYTIETASVVLFIVAAASIFGWLLTATRVTDAVAASVLSFTHSPWVFLLLANVLMLFVGCFLEPTAAILILVPVLM